MAALLIVMHGDVGNVNLVLQVESHTRPQRSKYDRLACEKDSVTDSLLFIVSSCNPEPPTTIK